MISNKNEIERTISLGFAKIVLTRILKKYNVDRLPEIQAASSLEDCLGILSGLEDKIGMSYLLRNAFIPFFEVDSGITFSDSEFIPFDGSESKTVLPKELIESINGDLSSYYKAKTAVNNDLTDGYVCNLAGSDPKWLEILKYSRRLAVTDIPVLITGETGTEKEEVAQFIHQNSIRHQEPFVPINCGALPDNLIESELYGYSKGAYTGAHIKGKIGRLEVANGGTVLLDEIDSLSLDSQAALLRFLETGEIQKVGSTKNPKVNTRIIATSNKNLYELVKRKEFREDLFYRLNVFTLKIPPLRDRKGDIPVFTHLFLKRVLSEYGIQDIRTISDTAMKKIVSHDYPGNLRELHSVISRALIIDEDKHITPDEILFDEISGDRLSGLDYGGFECQFIRNCLEPIKLSAEERKNLPAFIFKYKDTFITNQMYVDEFGLSSTTVRMRMKKLCGLGLLKQVGSNKGSRYLVTIDRKNNDS